MKRQLILASQSPRRRQILRECGWNDFLVEPSNAMEIQPDDTNYFCIALLNAELKTAEVSARYPDAVVIGSDTVIEFERRTIGKPRDLRQAAEILRQFSGKHHTVSTGVCIQCLANHLMVRFTEHSQVYFRELSDADIQKYLSLVPVLDKAGAYGIQEHGDLIIERYEGSFTNIMGFPAERFTEAMKNAERLGLLDY